MMATSTIQKSLLAGILLMTSISFVSGEETCDVSTAESDGFRPLGCSKTSCSPGSYNITCNNGFSGIPGSMATCNDGEWELNTEHACGCPKSTAALNFTDTWRCQGNFCKPGSDYSHYDMKCRQDGYTTFPDRSAYCNPTGVWSFNSENMCGKGCSKTTAAFKIKNGFHCHKDNCAPRNYSSIYIACKDGGQAIRGRKATCSEGEWEFNDGNVCRHMCSKTTAAFKIIRSASCDGELCAPRNYRTKKIKCMDGLPAIKGRNVTCETNGDWSFPDENVCEHMCSKNVVPGGVDRVMDPNRCDVNELCRPGGNYYGVRCKKDYMRDRTRSISCNPNGSWTGTDKKCFKN